MEDESNAWVFEEDDEPVPTSVVTSEPAVRVTFACDDEPDVVAASVVVCVAGPPLFEPSLVVEAEDTERESTFDVVEAEVMLECDCSVEPCCDAAVTGATASVLELESCDEGVPA